MVWYFRTVLYKNTTNRLVLVEPRVFVCALLVRSRHKFHDDDSTFTMANRNGEEKLA
jgi:hypothetical protein